MAAIRSLLRLSRLRPGNGRAALSCRCPIVGPTEKGATDAARVFQDGVERHHPVAALGDAHSPFGAFVLHPRVRLDCGRGLSVGMGARYGMGRARSASRENLRERRWDAVFTRLFCGSDRCGVRCGDERASERGWPDFVGKFRWFGVRLGRCPLDLPDGCAPRFGLGAFVAVLVCRVVLGFVHRHPVQVGWHDADVDLRTPLCGLPGFANLGDDAP